MPVLASLLTAVTARISWASLRSGCTLAHMHAELAERAEGPACPPLTDDIAAYRHDLTRRGISPVEARLAVAFVELMREKLEIRSARGIRVDHVLEFLSDRTTKKSWSPKTHDNYLSRLRDFGSFLVERGRLRENPFTAIRPANREKTEYGGENTGSRAFGIDEERAVVAAAEEWCEHRRASGRGCNNRDWCYILFGCTGLRRLEMVKLPWSDVCIDQAPFKIVCSAKWTKSKRWKDIPLCPEAVEILRKQRACTHGLKRVWASVPSLNVLNRDMERAGVAKLDARGRAAGFHSFRKALNTKARLLKADPEVRRNLLRHEKLELTLGSYSDIAWSDMEKTVAALPRMGDVAHELSTIFPQSAKRGPENLTERGEADDHRPGVFASTTRTIRTAGKPPGSADHSRMRQQTRASEPGFACGPASGRAARASRLVARVAPEGSEGSNPSLSACNPRYMRGDPNSPSEVIDLVDALLAGFLVFRDRLIEGLQDGGGNDGGNRKRGGKGKRRGGRKPR